MAGETVKSGAVCLRIVPWSQTSHIVRWMTPGGKVATVVKGAVRPKSQFLGQYDLNYSCEIVYYAHSRGELHALRECVPRALREELRGDYRSLALADYMRMTVEELAPGGPDAADWFALLEGALDALAARARGGAAGGEEKATPETALEAAHEPLPRNHARQPDALKPVEAAIATHRGAVEGEEKASPETAQGAAREPLPRNHARQPDALKPVEAAAPMSAAEAPRSEGGAEMLRAMLEFELSALKLSGLEPELEAESGNFTLRGERRMPVSPEVAAFIREPAAEKKMKILLDAARVIGVFYTFHTGMPAEVRRGVLKMISEKG